MVYLYAPRFLLEESEVLTANRNLRPSQISPCNQIPASHWSAGSDRTGSTRPLIGWSRLGRALIGGARHGLTYPVQTEQSIKFMTPGPIGGRHPHHQSQNKALAETKENVIFIFISEKATFWTFICGLFYMNQSNDAKDIDFYGV